MSLAKVHSAAVVGLDAQIVEVEVDLSSGLHSFTIVGLPDAAINESKERISSAIKNTGAVPPHHSKRRVIVNLAPADLKKQGPAYDLPIAVAFLLASGQIQITDVNNILFVGELSLEGKLRYVNGILPIALAARDQGFHTIILPQENAIEASLVHNISVIPVDSLESLLKHFSGAAVLQPQKPTDIANFYQSKDCSVDFKMIKGQLQAKRALEIAAAGSHNVLMSGPPGAGKTLLAKALPSILPAMTKDEILEVTKIFSVAGQLSSEHALVIQRPFRSPHHTASTASLVGGGSYPRPGEITLAHRGVLFLDEFGEFNRSVLDSLRQPLEDGIITVARAKNTLSFPAKFMLVAATNPCPCGNLGSPHHLCKCSPSQVSKYNRKLSGPLLDRIDLHLEVPALEYDKMTTEADAEDSATIRRRVHRARQIQQNRFLNDNLDGVNTSSNSEMSLNQIKKYCVLDSKTKNLVKQAILQMHLTMRSYHRLIKLARTIADLAESENILDLHMAEALQYRVSPNN